MEVITIYWLVWFKRKPYSILGRTHTWLSFSVSCQSTTVPVPQSPAALQPRCSGHNRAWAPGLSTVTSCPYVIKSSCWRTTQRTWLTSPTFLGLTSCRFGHRQHSRIPGSLDYARWRINTHDYTSRPRCAAVLGLMHERPCCAIAHLFQHAGGGKCSVLQQRTVRSASCERALSGLNTRDRFGTQYTGAGDWKQCLLFFIYWMRKEIKSKSKTSQLW